MSKNILVTGGAGFIGSHVVRYFLNKYPNYMIINLDNLTYAGNLKNLTDIQSMSNYKLLKNICDFKNINKILIENKITHILHLAAESHVDGSISDPFLFAKTM